MPHFRTILKNHQYSSLPYQNLSFEIYHPILLTFFFRQQEKKTNNKKHNTLFFFVILSYEYFFISLHAT